MIRRAVRSLALVGVLVAPVALAAFGQFIFRLPSSGTATITPNDASLVRYVVCYNDSVPYEVDYTSPYTCGTPPTYAHTYYVRTDGNDSNAGTTNSAGGAWLTIGKCASTIVSGDVCRVQAGTYAAVVTETTDGSAGNTITYVADGAVNINGFVFSGSDYVRVIGFTANCASVRASAFDIVNASNVEVWNNTANNCIDDTIRTDGGGKTSAGSNDIIFGNVVNSTRHPDNDGSMDFQIRGNSNLIAYNESYDTDYDFLYLFGQSNRVMNNYEHDISSDVDTHTDFIQSGADATWGLGQSLYEANFLSDSSGTDHHCMNIENNGTDAFSIFRRNVWSTTPGTNSTGQCYAMGNAYTDTKIYHETLAYMGTYVSVNFGGNAARKAHRFNIYYQGWVPGSNPDYIYDGTPADHDYNIAYDIAGSPTFPSYFTGEAHTQVDVNPVFVNASTRDFHLQSGSPARDVGGSVTTTSGSGTGTTFNVASGGGAFFRGADTNLAQYSGNLAKGDIITVGTDVVEIASISTDAITVTASFTWANGDPVYLGTDTNPDIGAYPYKSGGYTLSATKSGNPSGSANFSARVYPLYASATLWAVAN